MRSRRLLAKKLQKFYTEVSTKRNNQKMRLQVDQEFQQNEIKQLNKKYLVKMFSTEVSGRKAFAAEQKIRELNKRISKLNLMKNKSKQIMPIMLIKKLTDNMNKTESAKYGYSSDYIEEQSLSSKRFRISFNFDRLKKSKQVSNRLDKYDKVLYSRKKKKPRENLDIGKNILLLAEGIKKKSAPGKLYKSSAQNISYFNKERLFAISSKKTIHSKTFHWVADTKNNKILKERFQRPILNNKLVKL